MAIGQSDIALQIVVQHRAIGVFGGRLMAKPRLKNPTMPLTELTGRLTRALPCRRWQAAHWLGKLFVPRKPFIGTFRGGRIEVHPGEVASESVFFTGFYEREVTIWCLHELQIAPPTLVVDVGANFGYYPLLFGLASEGRTKSIAFEPDPTNFSWLRRNLELNPSVKSTAVQAVVGDLDKGTVAFEIAKEGHSLWSKVAVSGTNEHAAAAIEVPTLTLDTYLAQNGIEEVPLTLVDVEGYEDRVIAGMNEGIAQRRYRTVMLEFHRNAFSFPSDEIERLAGVFLNAGYRGYRFIHHTGPKVDKDPRFHNLNWDASILGALTFNSLTEWEHYLFVS